MCYDLEHGKMWLVLWLGVYCPSPSALVCGGRAPGNESSRLGKWIDLWSVLSTRIYQLRIFLVVLGSHSNLSLQISAQLASILHLCSMEFLLTTFPSCHLLEVATDMLLAGRGWPLRC